MKNLKILHALEAVFLFQLCAFSQATTAIIEGNLIVQDDPSTPYYNTGKEGSIVVRGNLYLSETRVPHTYDYHGSGNIFSEDRSVPDDPYTPRNTIAMGGWSYGGTNGALIMGAEMVSNVSYSAVLGRLDSVQDIQNSIYIGRESLPGYGYVSGIKDSVVIRVSEPNDSLGVGRFERSLSLGKIKYLSNWICDSITLGEILLGGAENSILSGKIDLSAAYNQVYYSFIMGNNVKVLSNNATSSLLFGSNITVENLDELYNGSGVAVDHIFAFGLNNRVKSRNTHSMGTGLIADSQYSLTIGRYNKSMEVDYGIYQGEYYNYENHVLPEDPVFIIGNGTSDANRSNALVVSRKGDAELSGEFKSECVKVKKASGGISMGNFGRE